MNNNMRIKTNSKTIKTLIFCSKSETVALGAAYRKLKVMEGLKEWEEEKENVCVGGKKHGEKRGMVRERHAHERQRGRETDKESEPQKTDRERERHTRERIFLCVGGTA